MTQIFSLENRVHRRCPSGTSLVNNDASGRSLCVQSWSSGANGPVLRPLLKPRWVRSPRMNLIQFYRNLGGRGKVALPLGVRSFTLRGLVSKRAANDNF